MYCWVQLKGVSQLETVEHNISCSFFGGHCYTWGGIVQDSPNVLYRVITAPRSTSQISEMDPVTAAGWCEEQNG